MTDSQIDVFSSDRRHSQPSLAVTDKGTEPFRSRAAEDAGIACGVFA